MYNFVRKHVAPLCLILVLTIPSCNFKQQPQPAIYNDLIVDEIRMSAERMFAFYESPDKSLEQLDGVRNKLLVAKERIAEAPSPESPTYIKKASTEILEFYYRLCEEENQRLIALTNPDHYTPEDSLAAQQLLIQIIKENNLLNGDFAEAQKKYASKHNLLLVQPH